jgi:cell wall-associated NlpC family hydrolase
MLRAGVAILVLFTLLGVLLVASPAALAQPAPPPNPGDDELDRSRQELTQRAEEVGRLTAELAELETRTDELAAALAASRETAEEALLALHAAQAAAAEADRLAGAARIETEAASGAIDQARARLDEFVVATYQQGIDTGPLALLTAATSPQDLADRAEFTDLIARSQLAAQDGLERARVDKANADARARAALAAARDREAEAELARTAADSAFAAADRAAGEHAAQLAALDARRAQVQSRLDAAEAVDATLRAQRARYDAWRARIAAEQAARDRAEQAAAARRVAAAGPVAVGGSAAVQRVIDRAMSQLGVQYVWGGGNGRGPSTGIPDRFGSPLDRVGFDCSGLMQYAYSGVGVSLPRVSRNQFHAGRKVPISELRPGDLVFYRNGGAPIHHVAMYIGGGKMIEAPYTGGNVRVTALRTRGLLPTATRLL